MMAATHHHTDECSSYEYDVFLSFRGEDTRHTFTGSLYRALSRKGLKVFLDDDGLNGGDQIKGSLVNAIQRSRISMVVLSQNYASSTWCLDELVEILECSMRTKNHLVWPIFYRVEPSHVRHQRYSFAQAMADHEHTHPSDKLNKWRSALSQVAGFSGWHYHTGRYEYEFIEEIVKKASMKLQHEQLDIGERIIGLEKRIEEVKSLLEIESYQTVCMLGIHGTGGIGKTTLAKALFNSIVNQFECTIFLENVRERSNSYMGLVHLQEAILYKLFEGESIKLSSVSEGTTRLKDILQHRKVLLVLDDVDSEDQLEKLAGNCNWFRLGSRIIITTRDKHVLDVHDEVEKRYEMKRLNPYEALELFSWKAFKRSQPMRDFIEVSNRVIHYAGGLPLVLKVIGSHLAKKSVQECEGALDQYERIPDKNIHGILKISYDSLEDNAKSIFLDIACFFKGKELKHVMKFWEKCDFFPSYNIGVLVSKSLIVIINDYLWMHDLIRGMGRELVRQEAPRNLGERSRLYHHQDVLKVLKNNLGSGKIEGIMLEPPKEEEIKWDGEAFKKMDNLRILIIRKTQFDKKPKFLPNSLRVLEWEGYPSESLPLDFHPNNIFDLSLPCSHLNLERGKLFMTKMEHLSRINFTGCEYLTHFRVGFGVLPNLSELNLQCCTNLISIDHSVGFLPNLKRLDAAECINLQDIPPTMSLPALELLSLTETNISFLPHIDNMTLLSNFHVRDCPLIKEVPGSFISNLMGLEQISIGSERGGLTVGGLPSGIFTMPNLKRLCFYYCGVQLLRESLSRLLNMATTGSSSSYKPPPSFAPLRELRLSDCGLTDEDLHVFLCCFPNLEELFVDGNEFVSLPESITGCSNLAYLDVSDNKKLEVIPELPKRVQEVCADYCPSLSSQAFNTLWSLVENEICELQIALSEIPEIIQEKLDYRWEGRTLSFWARGKFPVLALAFVVKENARLENISLWINEKLLFNALDFSPVIGEGVILDLRCLLDAYELSMLESYLKKHDDDDEWNAVKIVCKCWDHHGGGSNAVSYCGAYVYKQETNMEDISFHHHLMIMIMIIIKEEDINGSFYGVMTSLLFKQKQLIPH